MDLGISRLFTSCMPSFMKSSGANKDLNKTDQKAKGAEGDRKNLQSSKNEPKSLDGKSFSQKPSSGNFITRFFSRIFGGGSQKEASGSATTANSSKAEEGKKKGEASGNVTSNKPQQKKNTTTTDPSATKNKPGVSGARKGGKRQVNLATAARTPGLQNNRKDSPEITEVKNSGTKSPAGISSLRSTPVQSPPPSPPPQLINAARKTNDVAENILGSVTVTSKKTGKEADMQVIKKVGEGKYSKAFLVKIGKQKYVIMRPSSGISQENQCANAKEARHSKAVRSFLNPGNSVEGIQNSGKRTIKMTSFVTEEGISENLGGSQEGELLPYYDSGDLKDSIYEGNSMTKEQRVSVVNQLLTGSYHMMLQGVSHGDIKPGNVFLNETPEGLQACHGDWGGAKIFNEVLAGNEEHSFSQVLAQRDLINGEISDDLTSTSGYRLEEELLDTEELYNNPSTENRLEKIAGKEIMRDHFALAQTLLEVFLTGPIDGSEEEIMMSQLDVVDLREDKREVREEKVELKIRVKDLKEIISIDVDKSSNNLLNAISKYCEKFDVIPVPNSREEAIKFVKKEKKQLKALKGDISQRQEVLVSKQAELVEAACIRYPEQETLIRNLDGMSNENIADRTSIRDVIQSAIPEDQVQEIENRPGADVRLLNNRLDLARS
jgi:serine/threonine protein kinase